MARRPIQTLEDLDEFGGDYVRPSDCARVIDSSTTFVHKLIAAGSLRDVIRVGKHYRIPAREVRRLVLELRVSPTATTSATA